MSVLVTGAGGFLGSVLVARLLASGEGYVRCFVRANSDLSRLQDLRRAYPSACIDQVVGNLACRSTACHAVQGIHTVYHLAAAMRGAAATLFHGTVVASESLLQALDREGGSPRVVLTSSLGVYGTSDLPANCSITENCPLDPKPEGRDSYTHAKIWQEQLFRDFAARRSIDLVVVRPGVLYGPGGKAFPSRVGIVVGDTLFQLGDANNLLPLSYVENCADAIVLAGTSPSASGQSYNVLDDDLPTVSEFIQGYKRQVAKIPSVHVPYGLAMFASRAVASYHRYSRGQIPALLTPYKTAAIWKGHRFENQRIKALGWKQGVPTAEALRRTFASFASLGAGNLRWDSRPTGVDAGLDARTP